LKPLLAISCVFLLSCSSVHLHGDGSEEAPDTAEYPAEDGEEDPAFEELPVQPLQIQCRGSGAVAVGNPRTIEVVALEGIVEELRWAAVEFPEGHSPDIQETTDGQAVVTLEEPGYYEIEARAKGFYGEEEQCIISLVGADPDLEFITACPPDFSVEVPAMIVLTADVVGGTSPVEARWFPVSLPAGVPEEDLEEFSSESRELTLSLVIEGAYQLGFEASDSSDRISSCMTAIDAVRSDGLVVVLTWNPPDHSCLSGEQLPDCDPTDLDLHLVNLDRATRWYGYSDCHFSNCIAAEGRFLLWDEEGDHDNPVLYRDDRNGYGPEVISIKRPSFAHGYAFAVQVFDNRAVGFDPFPVVAEVEVFYDGESIFRTGPTDLTPYVETYRDFWAVAEISCDPSGCRVSPIHDENGDLAIFYHERATVELW